METAFNICPSCSGKLSWDASKNIYRCEFCGGIFDINAFRKESLLKRAYYALRKGEFKTANASFDLLLSSDPSDIYGVRGKMLATSGLTDSHLLLNDTASDYYKFNFSGLNSQTKGACEPYFKKASEMSFTNAQYRAQRDKTDAIIDAYKKHEYAVKRLQEEAARDVGDKIVGEGEETKDYSVRKCITTAFVVSGIIFSVTWFLFFVFVLADVMGMFVILPLGFAACGLPLLSTITPFKMIAAHKKCIKQVQTESELLSKELDELNREEQICASLKAQRDALAGEFVSMDDTLMKGLNLAD